MGWTWCQAANGRARRARRICRGREFITIQNEWATARVNADTAFLEKLYAEEFRITGANGAVIARDVDIALFASGEIKAESITYEDMKVSVYGDSAVVTGRENLKGTYKGQYSEGALRFTNVYIRRDGRWQLAANQGTWVQRQ